MEITTLLGDAGAPPIADSNTIHLITYEGGVIERSESWGRTHNPASKIV